MRSYLTSFLRAVAGAFRPGLAPLPTGWQPSKPGPTAPPRAPEGWTPPRGAINPITQRPFA